MMNKNIKKSFVFYDSFLEAMKHLNDKEFRECVLKIRDYALEGIDVESKSQMLNVIMELAKPNLDSARKRYMACVENGKKGAEYGQLGGAPKGNQNARKKQPLKQPLDVDVNDNVEEDVNENEEVNVDAEVPSDSISSFSNSSIGFLDKEIENDRERFEERENQYQSNDLIVDTASKGKGETHINSNSKSNNSALVSPYTEKEGDSSANQPQRRKEPGMTMSEYMGSLIEKDIIHLANMQLQGRDYDKTILNRAIDNLIALYGDNDRKSWYKILISTIEKYTHSNK